MRITYIGPIHQLKINSITLKTQPQKIYWKTSDDIIKDKEVYKRFLNNYLSTSYNTKLAVQEEALDFLNRQAQGKEKDIIKYMILNNITRIDQDNEYLHYLNGICSCLFYKEKEIKPLIRKK